MPPLPPVEIPKKGEDAPYVDALAVDFSSDQVLTKVSRAIYLSTAGTLKVQMWGGTTPTLILAVGWHRISIVKIFNAGSATAVGFIFF